MLHSFKGKVIVVVGHVAKQTAEVSVLSEVLNCPCLPSRLLKCVCVESVRDKSEISLAVYIASARARPCLKRERGEKEGRKTKKGRKERQDIRDYSKQKPCRITNDILRVSSERNC